MNPPDVVNPPPSPKILDYPALMTIVVGVAFTALLLVIISRFDPTGGTLAISILVTLTFVGVVAICLFYTIPSDQATAAVIGGLVAAFGAVVSHWLGRRKE